MNLKYKVRRTKMLCKGNYNVVIIKRFILHQDIIPKYLGQCSIKTRY